MYSALSDGSSPAVRA
ncbi:hypothetical protein, partial [Tsukamurella strandjordii]